MRETLTMLVLLRRKMRFGFMGLTVGMSCFVGNTVEASRVVWGPDAEARPDLELQSELWSSIFLKPSDNDEAGDQTDVLAGSVLAGGALTARPGEFRQKPEALTQSGTGQVRIGAEMAGMSLEEQFLQLDVNDATDEAGAATESFGSDDVCSSALSDWEQAVCSATGGKKRSSQNGPSVVTGVVAVVGAIVVGGAYLKSNRRS